MPDTTMLRASSMLLLVGGLLVRGLLHPAFADDASIFSGPQPGEALPPLEISLAYGERIGEVVDVLDLARGRPTLMVIVNGANRPAAGLTRSLMNFAEMKSEKLFAAVVYLDADLPAAETYLQQAVAWWGVGPPVGIAVAGVEGPGAYGLNRNVNLTILLTNEGKVVANEALVQPSLTDGQRILRPVVDLIGERVPTMAELTFLSVPTRKLGDATWRTAPTDLQLRRLVCDALAAESEPLVDEAAKAIDRYVDDDSERQSAIGNLAVSMLRRNNANPFRGLPIVSHLKRWRKAFGEQPSRGDR